MYWKTENRDAYYYRLDKDDTDYTPTPNKKETNVYAMIFCYYRTKRLASMKVKRIKRPYYKLYVGDLEGYLIFKKLKDAKEFAEKTFAWLNN
jgi:hypothetical protein